MHNLRAYAVYAVYARVPGTRRSRDDKMSRFQPLYGPEATFPQFPGAGRTNGTNGKAIDVEGPGACPRGWLVRALSSYEEQSWASCRSLPTDARGRP
jgi:hypothetical protein